MRTVFKALSAVQADIAAKGISKNDTNDFDKYKFRGIDAVLNTLAPIFSKHGVLLVPSVKECEIRTIQAGSGKSMNHCKVNVDFTFYDSEGDSITHSFPGEAMDRGDKSVNKACTAAYKYFLFEAFTIPVEGTPDADNESHEISDVISAAQAESLNQRIAATNSDYARFCKAVGVKEVAELTGSQYIKADAMLSKKEASLENAAA